MNNLGRSHLLRGDHRKAMRHYREALALLEKLGNHYTQAGTLRRIAAVHHASGDVQAEQNSLRPALVILDRLGHPEAEAVRTALRSASDRR